MRTGSILLFSALAVALSGSPAHAQGRSAGWLVEQLQAAATHEASAARAAHHEKEAGTWQAGASLYGQIARNPQVQAEAALDFARNNIAFNRELTGRAEQSGNKDAAALYRASAKMWAELVSQLERGGAVTVRLPKAQMLKPIPGLPGTPWQALAAGGSQHAIDCQALAQRARACEQQMSQMTNDSLVNGGGSGDFMVVRRAQCNRAEELYLAQCGRAGGN